MSPSPLTEPAPLTETAETTQLVDTDTGRWLVLTETSSYLLDLDARTMERNPGQGAGPADGLPEPPTALLRRDEETIPMLELALCEVGRRALMSLDVRGDGVTTIRQTTLVRTIRPAD